MFQSAIWCSLLIGVSLCAAGSAALVGRSTQSAAASSITSFGVRTVGDRFEHTIDFTAERDDEIVTVITSCGCTVVPMELPRKVSAGERVPITVKVALLRPADDFRVRARVFTRSGATQDFMIQGKVVPKAQP